jgi:hypothetical protein
MAEQQKAQKEERVAEEVLHHPRTHHHLTMEVPEEGKCHNNNGESKN